MPSENTIYFYPGRGGHSHNGNDSSFIDTSVYSLFDFSWGEVGDPDRRASQRINYNAFRDFVITTVNGSILEPSGLVLQPGMVNGTAHIIARSIKADTIEANTLTANEIAANTITSNELAANFVLVNTIIASNNFNGTYNANTFALSNAGTTGWAISSAGDAVFTNGVFRGSLEIGANDYWLSNGAFALGGNTGIYRNVGGGITLGANVTILGGVVASSVATPGIDIDSAGNLTSNASTFGIYANGAIFTSSGNFGVDTGGNLYAENAIIYGEIYANTGTIDGDIISGGTISGVELQIGSNFSVNPSGNLIANNATITGILSAESGSRIGNFYFNSYGLTNGASSGLLGDINLDTFNNIIYTPWLRASDGGNRTDVRLGYIEMDRYGAGGPAQIRFNRERNGTNERYLAFALAGYESGGVIGSINQASASTVNYLTSSDSRLKINVDKPYDALVVINTLMPRLYKWRLDDEDGEHLGFFAQELYEVYPDAVGVGVDTLEQDIDLVKENPWGIDYSKIVPLLTKAIQELCIKVEVLEQKVVELESN